MIWLKEREIEFNYFYKMFREEYRKNIVNTRKEKQLNDCNADLLEILTMTYTKGETLQLYENSLFQVCVNYLSLADSSMNILPNNSLEFVAEILNEIEENPYQKSFLSSLQFIFQDYFECLEIGRPILFSSEEDSNDSHMEMVLDSQYKIAQFETTNMDLLEQTKTMTKVLILESHRQLGPISKVKYYYRKDI